MKRSRSPNSNDSSENNTNTQGNANDYDYPGEVKKLGQIALSYRSRHDKSEELLADILTSVCDRTPFGELAEEIDTLLGYFHQQSDLYLRFEQEDERVSQALNDAGLISTYQEQLSKYRQYFHTPQTRNATHNGVTFQLPSYTAALFVECLKDLDGCNAVLDQHFHHEGGDAPENITYRDVLSNRAYWYNLCEEVAISPVEQEVTALIDIYFEHMSRLAAFTSNPRLVALDLPLDSIIRSLKNLQQPMTDALAKNNRAQDEARDMPLCTPGHSTEILPHPLHQLTQHIINNECLPITDAKITTGGEKLLQVFTLNHHKLTLMLNDLNQALKKQGPPLSPSRPMRPSRG